MNIFFDSILKWSDSLNKNNDMYIIVHYKLTRYIFLESNLNGFFFFCIGLVLSSFIAISLQDTHMDIINDKIFKHTFLNDLIEYLLKKNLYNPVDTIYTESVIFRSSRYRIDSRGVDF